MLLNILLNAVLIFGLLGIPAMSFRGAALATTIAPGSIPNRLPGLQNVYLAGQWLRMPGGLPMAAASGRDAALAVAKAAG
ncbi:MAG: hypothetical protein IJM21_08355 [Clostridia bacterium]|nr:hypothetical protein [Clostridia bacterium]